MSASCNSVFSVFGIAACLVLIAACGEPQGRGEIVGVALPDEVVQDKQAQLADTARKLAAEG